MKNLVLKNSFIKSFSILKSTFFLCFMLLLFVFSSCDRKEIIRFSQSPDGIIWFTNSEIRLRFDNQMCCKVFQGNTDLSLNDGTADELLSKPAHFVTINGMDITAFILDYDHIECEDIETGFGRGERLILKATAAGPGNCMIEQTLTVEMYENYPNTAITYTSYRNLGSAELTIDRTYSNHYLLDATLSGTADKSYEFWSYHGPADDYGKDYVLPLKEGFVQENYMGRKRIITDTGPKGTFGGGVPVVDLWTKNIGMGIALIEPVPKLVYIPVEVQPDQKVKVYIREDVNISLYPGECHQTLKSAVITHTLDYFDCLYTFAQLLDDQGMKIQIPSEAAYEPIWCGWGYGFDFTAKEILETLPMVKKLGIPWVVIDDRWYDYSGDWHVRKDLWPGGDEEMKALVDTLHQMGFKAELWWEPPTVQGKVILTGIKASMNMPGTSVLFKEHPEWIVMDKEGGFPMEDRRNYQLCPSLPEVQEYMRQLTIRLVRDWDFDGFKYDAYHTIPPCYNPAHNHRRPEESHEDLPLIFKAIYETAKSIKPDFVIENCNCGTTQDFFQAAWIDQPVASDPGNSWQVRYRTKQFKALMGPRAPAHSDHVYDNGSGEAFASAVGCGAVIATNFTWPRDVTQNSVVFLSPEQEILFMKWFPMYNEIMLSKGEYLNLYDIAYDKPESHVIAKGDTLYYAFYAKSWNGGIELRGLKEGEYQLFNYVDNLEAGRVKGPNGRIDINFEDYLLIRCVPAKK